MAFVALEALLVVVNLLIDKFIIVDFELFFDAMAAR